MVQKTRGCTRRKKWPPFDDGNISEKGKRQCGGGGGGKRRRVLGRQKRITKSFYHRKTKEVTNDGLKKESKPEKLFKEKKGGGVRAGLKRMKIV